MLSIVSLIWGMLAMVGLVLAFFPCLGSLNWFNIPFAVAGAVISLIAIFSRPEGGQKSAVIGLALCMIASLIGILRLVAGGGLL